MRLNLRAVKPLLFICFFLLIAHFAEAYEKMVFGVVEKITFIPENVTVSAKLDTGAKTSSLGVVEMKIQEENKEKWVHFAVNTKKGVVYFTKKLEGYKKIKIRHAEKKINKLDRGYVSRPVVLMEVQLGDRRQVIEVNLANRKNFIYPFLLGRVAIAQLGGIIDPSQRFTAKKIKSPQQILALSSQTQSEQTK